MGNGHHQQHAVKVGSQDVALLGQIGRLTHDIVAPVHNLPDICRPFTTMLHHHIVAHSHRIGATDSLEPKIALHLAVHSLSCVTQAHCVPAARASYHQPFADRIPILHRHLLSTLD